MELEEIIAYQTGPVRVFGTQMTVRVHYGVRQKLMVTIFFRLSNNITSSVSLVSANICIPFI